jgi:hypothetical protein
MNHFAPPLAAGDWIGGAIFLAVVIFSILAQLVGKWQEIQKEAARRARANPPQRPPQAGGQLEDEIAEFLRRRVQGQPPAPAERPAPPPPLPQSPAANEALRPFRPPPAPASPVVEAELVVVVPAEQEQRAVEHARDRLRRSPFGQPSPAGRRTEAAQTSAAPTGPVVLKPSVPAARVAARPALNAATIASLLANPATLRQAILLSEILHRPEERWR